ncbi:MAG: glycosyltransferase, partial [Candidatus Omnitrophica bacterium]|nr:glycosyltransferase [Candidatus Omnitrophota bacterium]
GNGDKIYQTSPSIFAIGGAMIFRKKDFLWLGGFDEIYRPNCWEDIDISYRAWKRGLKVLYEPRSLMYHKGKATLSYERHKEIKNELSFMWKNITDQDLLKTHLNSLPRLLLRNRLPFLRGFLWGLRYLPKTLSHRSNERRFICARDKDIIDSCMNYYRNFEREGFRHRQNTDKRNLLLITPFMPYPLNTGGRIRIHTLARLLKDRFNIFLLTLIDSEDEVRFIPELKTVFKDVYTIFPKTAPPKNRLYPSRYKYVYSQYLIDKLKELQRDLPLDLIQIESNELLYLTEHVKHNPVIYTEHDISILTFGKSYYSNDNNFIDYLKRFHFHYNMYKNIDKVIALSRSDEDILNGFFPSKDISLLTTGVDLEHFSFSPNSEKPARLIFVGNYLHYPNEDAILYFSDRILPLIRKERPDVELMIVGSNPTDKVKALAEGDSAIKVTGEVKDVAPYLDEAAIFVNPIRISAGIKGKVLEAMAKGVPTVSTVIGASGLFGVHGRDLLVAKNDIEFAGHVTSLLENRDSYLYIAKNARRLAEEKYDWNKLASGLGDIYQGAAYDFHSLWRKQGFTSGSKLDKVINVTNAVVEDAISSMRNDSIAMPEEGPEELHVELNYDCNCKCIMCELWDYSKRNGRGAHKEKLTLKGIKDYVEKSRYLKGVKTVVLSGGEPFLNKEFVDICRFFMTNLPDSSLGVLTNCFDTKLILKKMHQVLDGADFNKFWLGTSLDGIGKVHDKIRGSRKAFSNLNKTIKRCRQEFPGVDLCATFTLTPHNYNQLIPARRFADAKGMGFLAQFTVPKETRGRFAWREKHLRKIQKDVYKFIDRLIREVEAAGKDAVESIKAMENVGLISNIYYLSNLVDYQRLQQRFFKKCIAGAKFAMLSPFGELYFCPGLKHMVVGEMQDKAFDSLWMSDKAEDVRSFIQKGQCHCWLVCTVYPAVDKILNSVKDLRSRPIAPEVLIECKEDSQRDNISLNDLEYDSKKIVLESTPRGIGIGMHYRCNADCVFCLSGEHANSNLEVYKRFFEARLHDALPRAEYVNFCGFGELLLMPEATGFLDHINRTLPCVNKIITTNGMPLTDRMCERIVSSKYNIQVSLQASNPQLHKRLTRTEGFDRILKQIEHLRSIRPNDRNPAISLIFIANTLNIENLPDFVKLAHSLGVDEVLCNYMTVYTKAHLQLSCFFKQELTNIKLEEAERLAEKLNMPLKLPSRFGREEDSGNGKIACKEPWQYFYVEREGSVLPCCYAGDHIDYLNTKKFEAVWNGEPYQRLRKSLVNNNLNSWCRFCPKNSGVNINDIRSHVTLRPDLQKKILEDANLKK